jgi:NADPH-dependent ferric siderophore reductase
MFSVPTGDGRTFRRRYTIRQLDVEALLLDIDLVMHGDGPGAAWAAAAEPGTRVEAIGPRGKITVSPNARWHLFAAEESAIAATFAMVEALEPHNQAIVVIETDGAEDEQALPAPAGCGLQVTWVHRNGVEPGRSRVLVDALAAAELPSGPGHGYLNGELGVINELRALLVGRGLTAEQLSVKPYWRLGTANAPHGEPVRD